MEEQEFRRVLLGFLPCELVAVCIAFAETFDVLGKRARASNIEQLCCVQLHSPLRFVYRHSDCCFVYDESFEKPLLIPDELDMLDYAKHMQGEALVLFETGQHLRVDWSRGTTLTKSLASNGLGKQGLERMRQTGRWEVSEDLSYNLQLAFENWFAGFTMCSVYLFNRETRKTRFLRGHALSYIRSLCALGDSSLLAGCANGSIVLWSQIWDDENENTCTFATRDGLVHRFYGRCNHAATMLPQHHSDPVNFVQSLSSNTWLSACDRFVQMWRGSEATCRFEKPAGSVIRAAFETRDGQVILGLWLSKEKRSVGWLLNKANGSAREWYGPKTFVTQLRDDLRVLALTKEEDGTFRVTAHM